MGGELEGFRRGANRGGAFVACATGMIFESDPLTAAGTGAISATPVAGATILNQFRSAVTLNGLNRASPQPLSGEFVKLVDNDFPRIAPPEEADPPGDFTYDAPSREFAAVNAYHHCDGLFRRLQEMGFDVASYFDGTGFPVPVDACAFGDDLNARAPGNQMGLGRGQVRAFHND
jgi:zinc metalloprotease ZmpB